MTTRSLEERVKSLEDIVKKQGSIIEKQGKTIQVLDDINEVEKLMSRYVYMQSAGKEPEFPDTLFARNAPDVSWEVAHSGYYLGQESIRKVLNIEGTVHVGTGKMFLHTLTTPCIEIAADGKTAKGVWISPGTETLNDSATGIKTGTWAWMKFGCDFIKEDGVWKLWHYHVYRIFMTPCTQNYTDEWELKLPKKEGGFLGNLAKPDGSPSFDNPYSQTFINKMVPAPPEPYETFSKTFSYGPDQKYN